MLGAGAPSLRAPPRGRGAEALRGGAWETALVSSIDEAMKRLRAAERARRAAIEELIGLGVVRSHVLVGDIGERIAAERYGVPLQPAFTPGYDLIDRDERRIQVKTLRATPERPRTIIGDIRDPCDVILAIRLDFDYTPTEALEIPREIAATFVGKNGKISWTAKLASHPTSAA